MEGGLEFSYERLDRLLESQTAPKASKGKKENGLYAGLSEPESVKGYMAGLKHPLRAAAAELRRVILSTDERVGEGIFWNAPCFYFTGEMKPFDPKTYKRYIVGFNFFKPDVIRLIFLRGADVKKNGGLLHGDYQDGRRLALFSSMDDVKKNEKVLMSIVKELIDQMK